MNNRNGIHDCNSRSEATSHDKYHSYATISRSTDQIKQLKCTHKANDRNKSNRDYVMLKDIVSVILQFYIVSFGLGLYVKFNDCFRYVEMISRVEPDEVSFSQ